MGKTKNAYQQIRTTLEEAQLFEKDKENLKQGDTILAIKKHPTETREDMYLGTVKQTTNEKMIMEDTAQCNPDMSLILMIQGTSQTRPKHIKKYYKIKNTEQVKEQIKYGRLTELFEQITKRVKQTLEYKFATMDQALPIELKEMRPEKRLELTKRLEKTLEKKAENTNHKSPKDMQRTKELFEYAQNCGVVSEAAKQAYKEKMRKLKKRIRKLEMD